jgi:hypothetical protein
MHMSFDLLMQTYRELDSSLLPYASISTNDLVSPFLLILWWPLTMKPCLRAGDLLVYGAFQVQIT